MTFALCNTCMKAIFSWETPSMLPGLPADVEWTHYVRDDIGCPEAGVHYAVPCRSLRDRKLHCAVCRQPQKYQAGSGWACTNLHCPSKA